MSAFFFSLSACRGKDLITHVAHGPFDVTLSVSSDSNVPLAGATASADGKALGTTDADGQLKLRLNGRQGGQVSLSVECPKGYESPQAPVMVALQQFSAGYPAPTYLVRCSPINRTVVVAFRAENGFNLPILWLGQEVGRTDGAGVAHLVFKATPGDALVFVLGTDERGAERLQPKNPGLTATVADHDDYIILDQKFTMTEEEKKVQARKVAHVYRPSRI